MDFNDLSNKLLEIEKNISEIKAENEILKYLVNTNNFEHIKHKYITYEELDDTVFKIEDLIQSLYSKIDLISNNKYNLEKEFINLRESKKYDKKTI